MKSTALVIVALLLGTQLAPAQTQTAAASPPDPPNIRVGVTLFVDYTINQQPKIRDADGNTVTASAFNIGRSYINVTGNLTRHVSFRITPDVTRETGVGSALDGSYSFRLKFALVQWNLDDRLTAGSFARLGMQPNPWFEHVEPVYRYRFQGPLFEEREGYMRSADVGAVFRYNLPKNFGDVQTGFFNGEGFAQFEVNDQKSFMLRGSLRPAPGHAVLSGFRVTGYINRDAYVKNAARRRAIAAVTFENPRINAGFNYLATTDQRSVTLREVRGRGWSMFVTPRVGKGWEGLLRVDRLEPDTDATSQLRRRTIAGIAYWLPAQGAITSAIMLDVDNATFRGFSPAQPTDRRIALHALVNF